MTDIQYDSQQLRLEEISKVANQANRSSYVWFEKIVYADYVDVRTMTNLEENNLSDRQIRIFPNPSTGVITISDNVWISKVSVYSPDGQLAKKLPLQSNTLDIAICQVECTI